MQTLPEAQALLSNPKALHAVLDEVRGLQVDVIDGAAAGTAMAVPLLRQGDTIVQALVFGDTWAAPTSDKANLTIQPTKASATITISGNPVAGETVTVNGNVYTFRAAPTKLNEVLITAGNNTAMATALAAAINAYETRYESQLHGDSNRTAGVVATSNAGVVTVTSVVDGPGNAPVVSATATRFVVAGSGTGSVTATLDAVVATNQITVNGVQFVANATPTLDTHFDVAGTNALQATEVARAINAYQFKYGTLGVKTVAAGAVVTITPMFAPTGNAIALAEGATNVAASGAWLTGGTNTGGVKSTTNLSAASLMLVWFKK